MKIIDINTWERKEHFEFFSKFDEPYFGIVAEVDCTIAYDNAKTNKQSFFACYLHKALLAANTLEAFRYRIEDDKVVLYDQIHASPTIGRKDGSFGFSFIPFSNSFETFNNELVNEIKAVQNSKGLRLNENAYRNDTVQFSSIPWIKFTSLTHVRNFKNNDSVPKISFGKMYETNGVRKMAVAIYANHAFADGYHIGKFLEQFQKELDS